MTEKTFSANTLLIVSAIVLVAIIIAGTFLIINWKDVSNTKTISSTGQSIIEETANKAIIYLAYENRDSSAEAAQEKNKLYSDKILEELKIAGLTEKEIETASYTVAPEYDWTEKGQVFKDYLAVHNFKISTEKIEDIGKYIDAAIRGGANRIDNIEYALTEDKEQELKAKVLKQASEFAREKADAIASGSGTKVKKLISIQDTSYDYRTWNYLLTAKAESGGAMPSVDVPTRIETGKVTVQANVMAVFEIA